MNVNFIPAQESSFFINAFRLYTKWLFKRRFTQIWIHQDYVPTPHDRTVYFLNHTSWWDGLIPFLLNEYRFRQHARALMELDQMKKYPFFKKIGVFSINPADPAHTIRSMRYAVQSMQRARSSLFIYPEGEITPGVREMTFQPGIGWLYRQMPKIHFVPVGIRMHSVRHDRPELHIWVGETVQSNPKKNRDKISLLFKNNLSDILLKLRQTAGFDDEPYQPFFG